MTREAVGEATLSGGEFSFADSPPVRPLHYRAVYTDPATGIPYGALVRDPLSFPPPPDEDDDDDDEDDEGNGGDGEGDELRASSTLPSSGWSGPTAPEAFSGPDGLGLGVDDHVGDPRLRGPDSLLDLARARVGVGERPVGLEDERQVSDEAIVRAQEAELARVLAGHVPRRSA